MKLSFSTLGCPDWKFSEIISTARDLKFNGIEIRGVASEIFVPKARAFDKEHIEKSIMKLKEANLEVSMLTSGIALGEETENIIENAKEYIDLAEKLSCKYIRVMISSNPFPEEIDINRALFYYNEICKYGEDKGVTPLIETNGIIAESAKMIQFIEAVESNNKGVLWDIHHPYRYFSETPKKTYEKIGKYVKYIHVKDGVVEDDKIKYRMMGYGDVPIYDALKVLKENGYDGYLSLEWVKRWDPDLEEAGIVFAHFMSFISFLIERL